MHHALCTMHYALCTWGVVGQEGLYVTGCYHLYLPNAPLPPLTGSCLPRKHQKYWRRRRQVCKICKKSNPSSTLQTLKRNQKKMLKGTNVSSSIPPLSPVSPFLYGSSFVSFQRDVSPHPHPCLSSQKTAPSFTPRGKSSKSNKQLWHSKLPLPLQTTKIQETWTNACGLNVQAGDSL